MSETGDKANDTPRPGGIGPGERLQEARIKKSLSLEDVAGRMHLSPSILEAIEEIRSWEKERAKTLSV